jgi:hypothetical protein
MLVAGQPAPASFYPMLMHLITATGRGNPGSSAGDARKATLLPPLQRSSLPCDRLCVGTHAYVPDFATYLGGGSSCFGGVHFEEFSRRFWVIEWRKSSSTAGQGLLILMKLQYLELHLLCDFDDLNHSQFKYQHHASLHMNLARVLHFTPVIY